MLAFLNILLHVVHTDEMFGCWKLFLESCPDPLLLIAAKSEFLKCSILWMGKVSYPTAVQLLKLDLSCLIQICLHVLEPGVVCPRGGVCVAQRVHAEGDPFLSPPVKQSLMFIPE